MATRTRTGWWGILLLTFLASGVSAIAEGPGANLLRNGSFAAGLEHWVVESTEPNSRANAGRLGAGGCPDSECLQLNVAPGGRTSVGQSISGLAAGRRYLVEAQVHASSRQRVRIGLTASQWKGPRCARQPLTMFVESAGADDWQTLSTLVSIPERDLCGPTRGDGWKLWIEFEASEGARHGVMLNDLRVVETSGATEAQPAGTRPRCAYFADYENLDPCPGTQALEWRAAGDPQLATAAKWMLDEGEGTFIHDYVAGRNGVVEPATRGTSAEWREGALFFPGGESGSRVRVDAGQPIHGETFEISLEVSPAPDFVQGCLLASQPEGGRLGGFRLCVSQANQVLSFEMSDGTNRREYASYMPSALQPEQWSSLRVRGRAGRLEVLVNGRRIKEFEVPRLRLSKSPFALVIAGGVKKSEAGFRGKVRNVTLRDASPRTRSARPVPLGFVSRGRWSLDEGAGSIVRDTASNHHGLIENAPKRRAPEWHGEQLRFAGTPGAGGVMVRDAGPIYGSDFEIRLEAMFDDTKNGLGSLLLSNTGSGVLGGFSIAYHGPSNRLDVRLADGKRQVKANAALPFVLPAHEWIPIVLRYNHGQLEIAVSGVSIESFDFGEFELAPARKPMLIGAYYYPPSRGLTGSIRHVALLMRRESISKAEGAIKAGRTADTEEPCYARPLHETMIVGSNLLVPNWLGSTCNRKLERGARRGYIVELPSGFKLMASGANGAERGRVVKNKVKKLGKGMRDGVKTRRYRVELSYRSTAGAQSGFGPLFIHADRRAAQRSRDGKALPRMYFQDETRVGLEEPSSVALLAKPFPALPIANKLHLSIAWMELFNSMSWPDFLENYTGLGFNTVPTLALYDETVDEERRSKFLNAARRYGLDLLVVDSPYHSMIRHVEARTKDLAGVPRPFVNPAYRGTYYQEELERISRRNAEVQPDWFMMNIECFQKGAYACLIGNAPECSDYLVANPQTPRQDRVNAVTDLGNELIFDIRRKLEQVLPEGRVPRMGMYNSEHDEVYHRVFDFNKLYGELLDFAQPVIYRQQPDRAGIRLRKIRALMPRGDLIPWMDPGTVKEFPSVWIYDRVLEILGSGASGIAWFAYTNFEGADFYYLARALEAVIPVEDVIVGSEPMGNVAAKGAGITATGLSNGRHHLLLLSDYTEGAIDNTTQVGEPGEASPKPVTAKLRLPISVRGTLWDLARKKRLGEVDGRDLTIEWSPGVAGARTALYYVGPATVADDRFEID